MGCVEVREFSYTYPGEGTPTLSDINVTIDQGDFVVITGPSGSGKSTLGKALAGFVFQDEQPQFSGTIIVNLTDMTQVPLFKASQRVAYVQQNPEDQFCTLSVLDEIAFALENACLDPQEIERRIDEALGIVKGLNLRDRLLATLSGGEKQKVAIASMLALSPDVLILDEPTSNLDPIATQHVFETLHALRGHRALTIIIIEHKLSQLRAFDPKIFVMQEGSIISKTQLHEYLKHQYIVREDKSIKHSHTYANDQPILNISNLQVRLHGQEILQNFNLNLFHGEFVAVMGPNGSGKSTLLQTMMGFYKPEQGSIVGFGKDLIHTKTSALVTNIGFIFQNPDHQLFTQSVWDETTLTLINLGFLCEESKDKAQGLLIEIGLGNRVDDHPQRLSYGEKRRLNLVAVILHNPQLLLIDEFLIGQDMGNAHKWMRWLRNYTDEGHTVLLVNHHADLTQAYCDRVIFLDAGRKIVDAPVTTAFKTLAEKGWNDFIPHPQGDFRYA